MTIDNLAGRDGWIWHNGELVPWREAKVHVLTGALRCGVEVFDVARFCEQRVRMPRAAQPAWLTPAGSGTS